MDGEGNVHAVGGVAEGIEFLTLLGGVRLDLGCVGFNCVRFRCGGGCSEEFDGCGGGGCAAGEEEGECNAGGSGEALTCEFSPSGCHFILCAFVYYEVKKRQVALFQIFPKGQ